MTKKTAQPSESQKPVVTLTDSAAGKIRAMQEKEGKGGAGLRVGVITGGCAGLSYDLRFQKTPYDNDVVIETKGLKLFINKDSLPFIRGTEIDYIDTLKESGFKYKNPNAQSSCGCGTSFS